MAGGAAPEVPVAVYGVIALSALLGYVACRGLLVAWDKTFGALFRDLGHLLTYDKYFVHIHFGGPFFAADNAVQHALSKWAGDCDRWAGRFWHDAAHLQAWASQEILRLGQDTLALGGAIIHGHIPKYVKWALYAAFPPAFFAKLIGSEIAKYLPKVLHTAKAAAHQADVIVVKKFYPVTREIVYRYANPKAIAATAAAGVGALPLPGVIPRIWHGIDDLESEVTKLRKLERAIPNVAAAGVLAVALANVWGISAKCVRSGGPIGKVMRSLCGLPTKALNDLLGILADVWALENICVLLPLLETAASDIGTPLVEALTEVGAGLCHGAAPAGAMRGPAPTIPPVLLA